uniref:ELYS-like domain-containing protein n=4 Tax=Poecilia formosa TaxID=48698 RepID=A0A087XBZ4_POEFO
LLYFILDVVNFLQCKDNLLQSFCHAFTIPHRFSHQIKAFWMFDHGRTKASMELLLSPKAAVPQFSWQHRCIIISLLKSKQHHMALKYLQWTKPPIETTEDAKLYAEVFLLSSCLTDAWALLKRSHTENEDMVMYLLQACKGVNLHAEAVKYI